jgi:hypothetical protein
MFSFAESGYSPGRERKWKGSRAVQPIPTGLDAGAGWFGADGGLEGKRRLARGGCSRYSPCRAKKKWGGEQANYPEEQFRICIRSGNGGWPQSC